MVTTAFGVTNAVCALFCPWSYSLFFMYITNYSVLKFT